MAPLVVTNVGRYSRGVLIGREEERSFIGRLLADVRLGRSRSLVLRGSPGVGKTALLQDALRDAPNMTVLQVTGTEAESRVPFAALHALLRPLLGDFGSIPSTQARALRGALALEEADPDRLAAYAGTLSVLAAAAERQPLIVAIDDAQLLDRASLEALVFAARRVAGEAIGFVFTCRTGEPVLTDAGIETREVGSLPPDAALELLHSHRDVSLRPAVARRLVAATGGNALALVEVAAVLTDAQRAGTEPLDDPLPVTDVVAGSVRSRLRELPRATRDALLVAAAGAPPPLIDADALEPAEAVGLVVMSAESVAFAHPLIGAAIYRMASPARRRDVHRRLADALDAPEDADRRAWHMAAATDGPDEEAAQALESAASRAQARGGQAAQAQALARAAELSTDDDSRARRLIEAATAAYWAGDSPMAVGLAERALPLATDPLLHAMTVHRLAVIADWHGSWQDRIVPTEVLEREAEVVAALDPRRSVALLGVILQRHFQALDTAQALELAERRLALCDPIGDERHLRAIQDLARATGLRGDVARTRELCEEILDRVRGSEGGVVAFATNIAEPLLWLERYADCRALLERSVEDARTEGNVVRLMFELTNLALLELRTGAFAQALAGASEVASLAAETGNDYLLACNLAVLAHLSAARGDFARHEEQAAQAAEIAARLSDELIGGEVLLARAEAALADGRAADAVEILTPLHELARTNEIGEVGVLPYAADLIEALIRAGRTADAADLLEQFERSAESLDRRWAMAAAARCRGLLADADEFTDAFERALSLGDVAGWSPFQRARTLLLYGERLRRARRRTDARVPLRQAIGLFDGLGAGGWSERARAELEATGESIARRDATVPEKLTPQELQIALQVAEGRSNRDVAAALYLSPKTVEFHLTRVYRKLDVNSRAELIRLMARDT